MRVVRSSSSGWLFLSCSVPSYSWAGDPVIISLSRSLLGPVDVRCVCLLAHHTNRTQGQPCAPAAAAAAATRTWCSAKARQKRLASAKATTRILGSLPVCACVCVCVLHSGVVGSSALDHLATKAGAAFSSYPPSRSKTRRKLHLARACVFVCVCESKKKVSFVVHLCSGVLGANGSFHGSGARANRESARTSRVCVYV